MPLDRATIARNTVKTKIVDDPDHPGQPLNIAPANIVRLQHEVDKLKAQAERLKVENDELGLNPFCEGVIATLEWLQDKDAQRPWLVDNG